MGTRNLTFVYVDGEYKIAQYGQWDGYPEGQGATALAFLWGIKHLGLVDAFADKCRATKWISEEELKAAWQDCGAGDDEWVSLEISNRFSKRYPHLSRNTGAKILTHVMESEDGILLKNDIEFAGNSLFCEWAYVINLDDEVFEVYKGFNMEPLPEGARFQDLKPYFAEHSNKTYYPVSLIKTYPFSELPDEDTFLKTCTELIAGEYEDDDQYRDIENDGGWRVVER
jgi:hypothetical protein